MQPCFKHTFDPFKLHACYSNLGTTTICPSLWGQVGPISAGKPGTEGRSPKVMLRYCNYTEALGQRSTAASTQRRVPSTPTMAIPGSLDDPSGGSDKVLKVFELSNAAKVSIAEMDGKIVMLKTPDNTEVVVMPNLGAFPPLVESWTLPTRI
ncbi:hypothetical protein B0H34DRAFT_402456 [Crassisporium funariophilum]|nr:hypothetical protein B0H34DRAFT_402456 [Crassisporium funariophilum]